MTRAHSTGGNGRGSGSIGSRWRVNARHVPLFRPPSWKRLAGSERGRCRSIGDRSFHRKCPLEHFEIPSRLRVTGPKYEIPAAILERPSWILTRCGRSFPSRRGGSESGVQVRNRIGRCRLIVPASDSETRSDLEKKPAIRSRSVTFPPLPAYPPRKPGGRIGCRYPPGRRRAAPGRGRSAQTHGGPGIGEIVIFGKSAINPEILRILA